MNRPHHSNYSPHQQRESRFQESNYYFSPTLQARPHRLQYGYEDMAENHTGSAKNSTSSKKRAAKHTGLSKKRPAPPITKSKKNHTSRGITSSQTKRLHVVKLTHTKPVAVSKKAGQRSRGVKTRPALKSSSSSDDDDDDDADDDDDKDSSPPPSKLRKTSSVKQIPVEQHGDGCSDEEDEGGAVPTAMFTKYSGDLLLTCEPPLRAQHRAEFMQRAFQSVDREKDDSSDDDMQMDRISTLRPESELDYICFVLERWGVDVNLKNETDEKLRKKLSHFRRKHKNGKHWVGKYHHDIITLPSGEMQNILRQIERNEIGRLVLSKERIFDAMYEWHCGGEGHFGAERTHKKCSIKYWNCTQRLVRLFCELCPECLGRNPKIKTIKGSRKPIKSKTFRERFQIDLIDMRKLRKRNPFRVLMRWIITIKDHATGYTKIDCIPRKTARNVAHILQHFFGHVGYPFIFHTDNGKEFIGKEVLKCLRQICPNILTVQGRPRVPRDQGSVESMNKTVKRTIQAELAERRNNGDDPNWTEILGSIASAVNNQCGRGKHEVPSYNAVFGYPYHQEVNVTKEEAC